ncbi:hypothetical protein WG66_005205 [Moniliophthora roreri]|nr:hypothetical protein WG66_005205 [Moniliophthora roreri]
MDPEQAEIRDFERRAKKRKREEENHRKAEAREKREEERQKRQQEKEQEKQRQDKEKKRRADEKEKKQQEKEEAKQGKEERKQKWVEYVTNNEWEVDKDFKHPNNMQTIVTKEAMKLMKPQLKLEELQTLPHEKRPTGHHPPESKMHLYSLAAVEELAKHRVNILSEELVWTDAYREPHQIPFHLDIDIQHAENSFSINVFPEIWSRKGPKERASERRKKEDNRKKAEDRQRKADERKRIQEQKEKAKLEKEERKQKWAEYVVKNKWPVDEKFQHEDSVPGCAMELFRPKLKAEEMETLPHDRLPTAHHPPDSEMHLFSIADVRNIAKHRADVLGEEFSWTKDIQRSRLDMSELVVAYSYTPVSDDPSLSQIIWMSEHLWGF